MNIVFQELFYKKWSYVVFQEIILKKVELRGFSGNYSKKKWSYVVFPEITGDTWLFRENVDKKRSFSVFPCVDSRKRVHYWNFCHDSVIEDCSKIRNKA